MVDDPSLDLVELEMRELVKYEFPGDDIPLSGAAPEGLRSGDVGPETACIFELMTRWMRMCRRRSGRGRPF